MRGITALAAHGQSPSRLTAKGQPSAQQGELEVVLDGHLTGHDRLGRELEQDLTGLSDVDVALLAVRRWGAQAAAHLTGSYALAVRDAEADVVTLLTDPLGSVPLYRAEHARTGAALAGTDALEVAQSRGVEPAPDDAAVYRYLAFGAQDDTEHTFFVGVQRVPVGHAVRLEATGAHTEDVAGLAGSLEAAAAHAGPRPDVTEELRALVPTARQAVDVPRAADAASVDLDRVHALVRAQGEPVASPTALLQDLAFRTSDPANPVVSATGAAVATAADPDLAAVGLRGLRRERDVRGLARTLASARGTLAARAGASRERAAVPVQALLHASFVNAHESERPGAVRDDVAARVRADALTRVLPGLLRVTARNARAAGREVHTPFASRAVLELVQSLPAATLAAQGADATLLRAVLPQAVGSGARSPEQEAAEAVVLALREPMGEVFASGTFGARPYVDAPTVRALFADFLAHPARHDAGLFWRLFNLELWLREFVDAPGSQAAAAAVVAAPAQEGAPAAAKPDHEANPGKQLDLTSEEDGHTYRRFPLQTALVDRDTDLMAYLRPEIEDFFRDLPADAMPAHAPWHFSVSEKIVAITQGRSYFTWEIRPSAAAHVLSRFVTRTPAGIGLGDPTTMQLAIQEAGLPRIVAAAAAGVAGKLARRRGVFYNVVGGNVRAIDGPTTYSTFPANVSAKLPPADPDGVARAISAMVRAADIPAERKRTYAGAIVMDANDLGRNALGTDSASSRAVLEATFADNPLGQGRERTPLAVVARLD